MLFHTDRERSPWCCWTGRSHQTTFTIRHRELDLDYLIIAAINRRSPTQTLSACWTTDLLSCPIHRKTGSIKAELGLSLPRVISARRGDQIDPILLSALGKLLRFCIIGIGYVFSGEELSFAERLMNERGRVCIPVPSPARLSMRNESRSILVPAFGEMHFIAGPPGRPFSSLGSFSIIGGADHFGWGRDVVI